VLCCAKNVVNKKDLNKTLKKDSNVIKGPTEVIKFVKIISIMTCKGPVQAFEHLLRVWTGTFIIEKLIAKNMIGVVLNILMMLTWPEVCLSFMIAGQETIAELRSHITDKEWTTIFWLNSKQLFQAAKTHMRSSPCWTLHNLPLNIEHIKMSSNDELLWDFIENTRETYAQSRRFKTIIFSKLWVVVNACFNKTHPIVTLYLQDNQVVFINYLESKINGQILYIYSPPEKKL